MMHHRILLPILIGGMVLGACGRRAPEPAVTPVVDTSAEDEARRRAAEEEEEARRRAEEERRLAEEARRAEMARLRAIIEERVHFDFDMFNIRGDAQQSLMAKAAVLRANPGVRLIIEGHADERGSIEYNLALGQRRANAVREFLVGHGLEANRFELQSFGKERPLDTRSDEDAWALNRRAEFRIVAGGDDLRSPGP